MKKWPFLWQLVEQGKLLTIDYAFAEHAESDEEAALLTALMAFYRLGHLCIKKSEKGLLPSLEIFGSHVEEWEELIFRAQGSALAIREDERFYLPRAWHCEQQFVCEVKRLLQSPSKREISLSTTGQLTSEQQRAVENALHYPLSLISGGPGTGKSYTAIQIVQAFLERGLNVICLAAPTGKAAANLEKQLLSISNRRPTIRCSTLHALLEIRSQRDLQKPPPWVHVDLLLIDECSMIDAALFAHLVKAVQGETHLVLIGDPHQLPAIEGGSFFADLIASQSIPCTHLSNPMRFGKGPIHALSQAILKGESEKIPSIPLVAHEEWIWEKVHSHYPRPSSSPPENIEDLKRFCLLSALRQGPLGVETLNEQLFRRFQKLGRSGDYFAVPILINRNDVRTGLCNGEIGLLIHRIGSKEESYALFEQGKRLSRAQLPAFEYAYAISVHKSQGSEYEEVLVLLPEGSEIFGRELLYTAATRAKKRLEIAGDSSRIAFMLKQHSGKISGICEKMKACCINSS